MSSFLFFLTGEPRARLGFARQLGRFLRFSEALEAGSLEIGVAEEVRSDGFATALDAMQVLQSSWPHQPEGMRLVGLAGNVGF